MARQFSYEKLVLTSVNGVREVDLDHPVIGVFGPIDTGKTTLVDALAYPLGYSVDWRQVPKDRLISVTVVLRVEGMRIALRRGLGSRANLVELIDPRSGEVDETLVVKYDPSGKQRRVGDVLLELLGLAELFAPPEAVAVSSAGAGRLSFEHLYPLCYLSQDMVDGGELVRGGANSASSYKAVVELLLHLTDARTRILTARLKVLLDAVRPLQARVEHVKEFLAAARDEHALRQDLEESRRRVQETLVALEEFKGRQRAMTAEQDPLRCKVAEREAAAARCRSVAAEARAEVERMVGRVRGLQHRAQAGPRLVSPCPGCARDLTGRTVGDGFCGVCTERWDASRLQDLLRLAETELLAAEQAATAATKEQGRKEADLAAAQAELDAHLASRIGPAAGHLEQLAAAHASAKAQSAALEQELEPYARLRELQQELERAVGERDEVKQQLADHRASLSGRQVAVQEIEDFFRHIIDALQLPGDPGAAIDRSSYLPRVRRGPLSNVGHGVRTVLNVAYRMAFTSHALVTGATDLPTLLVIDSPRKNVGYGTDDQQLISRLYTHFLEHITAVREGTTVVRPSQVIIVDNDLPVGFRDRLHVIELSRENPLVP
ncbi:MULTISPECIES: hypothetical protein [Kitasatospora]|uniref:Rad50/SbcC-type AAA domain-containing protein n=1 Tax=Kitasatospora setae (strain ATCC 33774 / DSM 43861 / JCM 3304 / KCC A-0304 / NBRC 14216 / KM-6054) TaxID=452652 RepID=E4MYW5_KITSK|nr:MULTISPECIES: hypothetical protein [Kitasatospora]BAJ25858.1 hypothetical protein KSE_00040t [Kitasatospora setae KM-6054]BAJ33420.1 hypothetical protein KSE_76700t [Kitasatospora setae KM-6054]